VTVFDAGKHRATDSNARRARRSHRALNQARRFSTVRFSTMLRMTSFEHGARSCPIGRSNEEPRLDHPRSLFRDIAVTASAARSGTRLERRHFGRHICRRLRHVTPVNGVAKGILHESHFVGQSRAGVFTARHFAPYGRDRRKSAPKTAATVAITGSVTRLRWGIQRGIPYPPVVSGRMALIITSFHRVTETLSGRLQPRLRARFLRLSPPRAPFGRAQL
jgi:hypothetical protein